MAKFTVEFDVRVIGEEGKVSDEKLRVPVDADSYVEAASKVQHSLFNLVAKEFPDQSKTFKPKSPY